MAAEQSEWNSAQPPVMAAPAAAPTGGDAGHPHVPVHDPGDKRAAGEDIGAHRPGSQRRIELTDQAILTKLGNLLTQQELLEERLIEATSRHDQELKAMKTNLDAHSKKFSG